MTRLAVIAALLFGLLLAGCTGWNPEKEGASQRKSQGRTPDGYYRVRRGDSLYAIAFKFGADWKDLAGWNGIKAPYIIYPDQELRVTAPGSQVSSPGSSAGGGTVITAAPAKVSRSVTYDVPPATTDPAASQPSAGSATTAAATRSSDAERSGSVTGSTPDSRSVVSSPPDNAPKPAAPAQVSGDPSAWLWPVDGRILSNFKANDPSRKGIDIGGKEGQPVVASAAGEVVYSGSGLIGYGELVIIKHNERLLSAYAHNQKRLVKEGQKVSAGERIADMGKNDRNQAMLHFEIRLNGNPQDPLKYLPSR